MHFLFWRERRSLAMILGADFAYLEKEFAARKLDVSADTALWAASSSERALFSIGDVLLRFGYNPPRLGISIGNINFPEKFVGLPSAISACTGMEKKYRASAGAGEKSAWLQDNLALLLPCFDTDHFLVYFRKAEEITYLEMPSPHGAAS